jgi:nucleotide-binding universal stress UspA family protein
MTGTVGRMAMTGHAGTTDEAPDPRRIVVGYAGTDGSDQALDWAIETAQRESRPLSVLHCYDVAHVPVLAATAPDGQGALLAAAADEVVAAAIERASKVLGPDNVSGRSVLGSAAGELVAESESAHLVVTGSHGRGRLLGGLLASTSYAVTAHAKCPAVVVRGDPTLHPDAQHRVVVGYDDSEHGLHALGRAADVAQQAGSTLHVLRVIHPPIDLHAQPDLAPMAFGDTYVLDDGRLGEEMRTYAEEATRDAVAQLGRSHPGLEVTTEVVEDSPGLAIARVGQGAGLIVVGSRGRGGFVGMLLGSVCHTVIHHATSPVMVVR